MTEEEIIGFLGRNHIDIFRFENEEELLRDVDLLVEKGTPLSLLALSCLLQDTKDALDLSVDLITTDGIEESFKSEISDTEVLLYEA